MTALLFEAGTNTRFTAIVVVPEEGSAQVQQRYDCEHLGDWVYHPLKEGVLQVICEVCGFAAIAHSLEV